MVHEWPHLHTDEALICMELMANRCHGESITEARLICICLVSRWFIDAAPGYFVPLVISHRNTSQIAGLLFCFLF